MFGSRNVCPAHSPISHSTASAPPTPATTTVNVYNASSKNGLAARTAAELRERGFVIGEVRNDPLRRKVAVAEVRSAIPLDDARAKKLADALSKATGRPIEVRVLVDPSVLGGVVAKVGDEIFDGSVRSRLVEARQQLTGTTTRSG